MSDLQLTLIALLPSIGTVISALVILFKLVFQFKSLRAEVRDDSTITVIKNDNKALRAIARSTQDQLHEVTLQIRAANDLIRKNAENEARLLEELEELKQNGRHNQ